MYELRWEEGTPHLHITHPLPQGLTSITTMVHDLTVTITTDKTLHSPQFSPLKDDLAPYRRNP